MSDARGELVTVVIPVFQNRESLAQTLTDVVAAVVSADCRVEACFVDDGSSDGSWQELERLQGEHPDAVTLVRLSRNFGQVNALLAGYEAARGDAVVTISADLQDPASLITEMITKWREGSDVVIAHRVEREDDASARIMSRMAYSVARRANPAMPAGGFDFLLMSRRAVELVLAFPSRHRFLQGDILWLGLPTSFLPYSRAKRPYGKSTWTFGRKLRYFTDLVLDSSFWPIQVMSRLGFFIALAGVLYAIVIVFARVFNQTPWPGWAPIMVTLLFIGGLIMVMLGIIGEYLWRIYDDIKGRPRYIVERHLPSQERDL